MNEDYFLENFNTKLSEKDEAAFLDWVKVLSENTKNDRMKDLLDYDLRGLWAKEHPAPTASGHFVDTYKKPNHPTFSTQSMYHGTPAVGFGGNWEGGVWGREGNMDTFRPSQRMLQNTHDPRFLQDYFKRVEPNARLLLK